MCFRWMSLLYDGTEMTVGWMDDSNWSKRSREAEGLAKFMRG